MVENHETAVKVGLLSVLLALAVLLSAALPPAFLAGNPQSQVGTPQPSGLLLVSVNMQEGGGPGIPLAGVKVAISQSILHGIRLALGTNASGQVEFPLQPGQYGVSLNDSRFSLETSVQVNQTTTTWLQVVVNRTGYYAAFADAQDTTTAGEVDTWNQLVVAVPASGVLVLPFGSGILTVVPGALVPNVGSAPRFGSEVFVQPFLLYGGTLTPGAETPASVVSQVSRTGLTWLTLQPLKTLDVGGASYLVIFSYAAGSTVGYLEEAR